MVQDEEVQLERAHVHQKGQDDEAEYTGTPMSALITLDVYVEGMLVSIN